MQTGGGLRSLGRPSVHPAGAPFPLLLEPHFARRQRRKRLAWAQVNHAAAVLRARHYLIIVAIILSSPCSPRAAAAP